MKKQLKMHNPPHPGEVLKELYLEPLGLSVTRLAEHLGVRRATMSDIINAKASVSSIMAIRLGKAFNTTPLLWLEMQTQYDLWQAQSRYNADDVKICC